MKEFKKIFLKMMKKFIYIILSLCIFIAIICGVLYASSNFVIKKKIDIKMEEMNDIKIVHLSDFNNKIVRNLSEKVMEENPDIVVITGDLVDKYKTTESNEDELLKQFDGITVPIYFVPGDMEHEYENYETMKEKMKEKGFHILENDSEKFEKGNKEITITGIVDSSMYYEDLEKMNDKMRELKVDTPQILLSHRAELMDLYAENQYDLVFTGHTHGGYICIPFVGALFASNQGTLPKYTNGKYTLKDTTMIVSSGLGVGRFPIRLFNQPEIISVTIS